MTLTVNRLQKWPDTTPPISRSAQEQLLGPSWDIPLLNTGSRITEFDEGDTEAGKATSNSGPVSSDLSLAHLPPSAQRTKCSHPDCGIELLKKTLPRHMRTVHGTEDYQFHCELCDRTFKRKDIYERHRREQHDRDGNLVECATCGSEVCSRALKEHFQSQKCKHARAAAKLSA